MGFSKTVSRLVTGFGVRHSVSLLFSSFLFNNADDDGVDILLDGVSQFRRRFVSGQIQS